MKLEWTGCGWGDACIAGIWQQTGQHCCPALSCYQMFSGKKSALTNLYEELAQDRHVTQNGNGDVVASEVQSGLPVKRGQGVISTVAKVTNSIKCTIEDIDYLWFDMLILAVTPWCRHSAFVWSIRPLFHFCLFFPHILSLPCLVYVSKTSIIMSIMLGRTLRPWFRITRIKHRDKTWWGTHYLGIKVKNQ